MAVASARRRVAARARRAAASVHASQAQPSTPWPTASTAIRTQYAAAAWPESPP